MVAGGMLENFPGCGSTQPKDSNQQPWLGALFTFPLDPAKFPLDPGKETEDRFVAPVALLSAKTKLHPNWPTVIVATGDIFNNKIMNSSSSTVSSEDLVSWVSAFNSLNAICITLSNYFNIEKWIKGA